MSYFLVQSLLLIRRSATEDIFAVLLVAVVLVSGSLSMNFNTQADREFIKTKFWISIISPIRVFKTHTDSDIRIIKN